MAKHRPSHPYPEPGPSRPWYRTRRNILIGLVAMLGLIVAATVVPNVASVNLASTEGGNYATCRTDPTGQCHVPHSLGTAPTGLQLTPLSPRRAAYLLSLVTGSETATQFAVRAALADGQPLADTKIRFRWISDDPVGDPPPSATSTQTTTAAPPTTTAPSTTTVPTTTAATTTSTPAPQPPAGSPTPVCGQASLNGGPASAPAGAVTVAAGDNSGVNFGRAGTTFWFEPGVHTLGSGVFSQIIPADNTTFVGAPGAVLDGQHVNYFAFTQRASNVTIRYLTIRNFAALNNEGVVNHDSGNNWVIEHNTITNNDGAAMMAGAGQKIIGNCLKDNGQYGLNAYQAGNHITGLVVEGNEFVGNNTGNWEARIQGCGCSGGMKFWAVSGANVRNNWIHHNHGTGLWADNNNNDFLIEGNLIEANEGMGIFYEISYNAIIRGNTLRNNAWVTGREFANRGDNFPVGAIYLSEAGGDTRVPARTSSMEITGNTFTNNWGGVVGWENSDRFCNSPAAVTHDCTLVLGADRTATCSQPAIASEPLFSNCRWKTQRLDIHHNTFAFDPTKVDGGCPTAYCGRSALFANYGSYPDWSPYKARVVQEDITFNQNNRWHDNTYTGPWRFVPYETGRDLTLTQWQAAPYNQDAGSTG
jgi:Right handed beta helix region